jgi:putative oxidoreductase
LRASPSSAFAVEIDNYQLLPWLAPYMAAALPALEITLALALVVLPAPWRRAAALGCLGLMVLFTVGAASAMARNLDIDCGCFGKGSGPITWLTIARDVALIAVSAVLVRRA